MSGHFEGSTEGDAGDRVQFVSAVPQGGGEAARNGRDIHPLRICGDGASLVVEEVKGEVAGGLVRGGESLYFDEDSPTPVGLIGVDVPA